jgi:hypothetical protein
MRNTKHPYRLSASIKDGCRRVLFLLNIQMVRFLDAIGRMVGRFLGLVMHIHDYIPGPRGVKKPIHILTLRGVIPVGWTVESGVSMRKYILGFVAGSCSVRARSSCRRFSGVFYPSLGVSRLPVQRDRTGLIAFRTEQGMCNLYKGCVVRCCVADVVSDGPEAGAHRQGSQ